MGKPLIVAKPSGPNWTIWYTDHDLGEQTSMRVIGSPTIDDAMQEARMSLNATRRDYTITRIELDQYRANADDPSDKCRP